MQVTNFIMALAIGAFVLSGSDAKSEPIQAQDLQPGFVMDFYPIKDTSKPDQPQGRAIASMIYKEGFPVTYEKPMEMQPALEKYRDNWWLIVFQGYLNLTENGEYTFATTLLADLGGHPNHNATCGAETKLNNVSVNKISNEDFRKTRNSYVDIPLSAGLYPIEIKYFCTDQFYKSKPAVEFAMRGPKDPILKPFAAKDVYHISR